jgi:hypothetical protein
MMYLRGFHDGCYYNEFGLCGADMACALKSRRRYGSAEIRQKISGFLPDLAFKTPADTPKSVGYRKWIDAPLSPPSKFITCSMVLAVMNPAQWNRKFVAVLASQRP